MLPVEAKKIVVEVYDAQDSDSVHGELNEEDLNMTDRSDLETDEDKIFYTRIGRTETQVDKVLAQLLVSEEFHTVLNIIYKEVEEEADSDADDVFSSNSLGKVGDVGGDLRHLVQIKGKLSMSFRAALTPAFVDRVASVKAQYLQEIFEQVQSIKKAIQQKKDVILKAIDCLFYINFDERYGLVPDQLQMLENSVNESFSALNQSRSGFYDREGGVSGRQNTRGEEGVQSLRSSQKERLKSNTQKEIESFENIDKKLIKQRMCGCDSMCFVF